MATQWLHKVRTGSGSDRVVSETLDYAVITKVWPYLEKTKWLRLRFDPVAPAVKTVLKLGMWRYGQPSYYTKSEPGAVATGSFPRRSTTPVITKVWPYLEKTKWLRLRFDPAAPAVATVLKLGMWRYGQPSYYTKSEPGALATGSFPRRSTTRSSQKSGLIWRKRN